MLTGAGPLSGSYIELLENPADARIRVTEAPLEVLTNPSDARILVTQAAIELAHRPSQRRRQGARVGLHRRMRRR